MISVMELIINKQCNQYSEYYHYAGMEWYVGCKVSADRYRCTCLIWITDTVLVLVMGIYGYPKKFSSMKITMQSISASINATIYKCTSNHALSQLIRISLANYNQTTLLHSLLNSLCTLLSLLLQWPAVMLWLLIHNPPPLLYRKIY